MGRPALILSPHCDDAFLSLGGVVQQLPRAVVLSLFSRSAWTRADGHRPGHTRSVTRLRQAEDIAAARCLGRHVRVMHGALPEAMLRGYRSLEAVFSGKVAPRDLIRPQLDGLIATAVRRVRPSVVFAPLGLGGHVDHRLVAAAAVALEAAGATPVIFYEDLPYAATVSDVEISAAARALRRTGAALTARLVPMTPVQLWTKLTALEAYASQLGPDDIGLVVTHAQRQGHPGEALHCTPRGEAALGEG